MNSTQYEKVSIFLTKIFMSFFCFKDEDTEALLAADFEIGHFIRERIVPRAVLYFTGEALENDDVSACFNLVFKNGI